MEYGLISIIVLALVIAIVQMAYQNRKQKAVWKERFRTAWGSVPERTYDATDLERLSRYFRERVRKGTINTPIIDDITWNDLDLDSIYAYVNHAKSTPGEEYLYYLLRTPVTDQAVLDERNRLMEYFETHEEERLQMQLCFAEIGTTRKFAMSDYIDLLVTLKEEKNFWHYVALCSIPIGIGMMVVLPTGVGFLFFLALIVFQIAKYYARKGEIEPYLATFGYIMKMLEASKTLSEMKIAPLDVYFERLRSVQERFQKFRWGSFLVMSGRNAVGSLEDVVLDLVRMLTHVDLLKFNSMLREVKKNVDAIEELVETIGLLDAMISAAAFRASLPFYAIPQLETTEKAFLEVHDVYHPLIAEPVANSIVENQNVLITGSNASGKSTFLKTVAINTILSQTLDTSIATSYRASFFQIYSSMALKDNLQGQESYYIVEIKSLKRILEHANDTIPMLCFVDEVLRGTNTLERISASSQILKSLVKENVLCFAATHDLELTQILEETYHNYHFQETICEKDILFNYKLYEGRAVSRNAIRLLRIIGYDEKIIEAAEQMAGHFLQTGEWL